MVVGSGKNKSTSMQEEQARSIGVDFFRAEHFYGDRIPIISDTGFSLDIE